MTAATPTLDDALAIEDARHAMVVSQLRPNAVTDVLLIAAMATTPRERFVPGALGALVYRDRPLPLGGGRELNAPLATARLINQAAIVPGERVLLIGTACGYAAVLVATLGAQVVAVECDAALAGSARDALGDAANVTLVEGVLAEGHAAAAPYDAIVVDGAVEALPDALVAQLRVGGRVVAGLDDRGVTRLATGARTEGGFALAPFADIDCVILPGFARPRSFQFPG